MTESTPPPRRPLATFLRATPDDAPRVDPPAPDPASLPVCADDAAVPGSDAGLQTVSIFDPPPAERDAQDVPQYREDAPEPPSGLDSDANLDLDLDLDTASHTASNRLTGHGSAVDVDAAPQAVLTTAALGAGATSAPSFMRLPVRRLHTPRWQWGVLAGLVVLLLMQIAVADRARLAADASHRPWIAGLCSVLRCTLPAWQEPAAFSMISRDVRPVPGQAGALQVQASFRNEARWAQGWPSLRLSLSDADGRVIGTGVFAPRDYLDRSVDATSLLEPGQSAQIAFRVREPAASTVAFTFEFL